MWLSCHIWPRFTPKADLFELISESGWKNGMPSATLVRILTSLHKKILSCEVVPGYWGAMEQNAELRIWLHCSPIPGNDSRGFLVEDELNASGYGKIRKMPNP